MKKWITLDIILSFFLIVLGGTVRNFDAGLACPDWPLCHGKIIPPFDLQVLLEWSHRLLASCVGFITLGICIGAWVSKKQRKTIGWISTLSLGLVVLQAALGAMTVIGLLGPHWVSSHLAVGLLFFLSLLWLYLVPGTYGARHHRCQVWGVFAALTVLVYLQAVLGSWVGATHAGLACPDFPTCNGAWIPPLVGAVKLHFFHRVMALMVLVSSVALYLSANQLRFSVKLRRALFWVVTGVVFQFGLGVSTVLLEIPKLLSILHLGVATLLVATLFVLTYKVAHASLS